MRKTNAQPLKEAIQDYLKAMKMHGKLREVNLIGQWEKQVGPTITKATKEIYVKDKKLFVWLNSSVIRNELMLIREPLKNKLNELAGSDVITEIVFR